MKQFLIIVFMLILLIFNTWLLSSGTLATMFVDSGECRSNYMPPITEKEIEFNESGKYASLFYRSDNFWQGKIYCQVSMLQVPFSNCRAYCRKIVEDKVND